MIDSGILLGTPLPALTQLTITLDYTAVAPGVHPPQVHAGTCTDPPSTMTVLDDASGVIVTTATPAQIEFTFEPDNAPGAWLASVSNYIFCVYHQSKNNRVSEQVSVILTLSHDSFDETAQISFTSLTNGPLKQTALGITGKDVLATAELCNSGVTEFSIGQEICILIGLNANAEYFQYALDSDAPFDTMALTSGTLSHTVTPTTPIDTTVLAVTGSAVNAQEVYFYLPLDFYYDGGHAVDVNILVNIVDVDGNSISRRLQVSTSSSQALAEPGFVEEETTKAREVTINVPTQEAVTNNNNLERETPDYVNNEANLKFNIAPVKDQVCIDVDTLIWVACGSAGGLLLCCLFAVVALRRQRKDQVEDEKALKAVEV